MDILTLPDDQAIYYEDRWKFSDGRYGWSVAKRKGNKFLARQHYAHGSVGSYGCKVVDGVCQDNNCFDVVLSTGDIFRVKALGKSSCIANIQSIFHMLGFGCYATWATKDFARFKKNWQYKYKNHSWI